ncbi:MAG: 3-phosphoshikimate 1-carboxyvinyltransferase [Verrucomicrobia bacterium]|nr:3-phosphoshikimate 1-carboxyvinyltransferase [Verrucomicrobiota bacterium]
MSDLRIRRAPHIRAEIRVPGDKSISHRAVLIAALSNGVCVLRGFLPGEDCQSTVGAMRALGVKIEQPEPDTLIVHGCYRKLQPPKGDIQCGNSGTTMRLLAGLLAGQPFDSRLVGDASLSRRPMGRVIDPLTQMGANIVAEGPKKSAPLRISGQPLHGIDYKLPVASAQVKSAVLLAGLFASGRTSVIEPVPSRDHTERLLNYYLCPVTREELPPAAAPKARGKANKGGGDDDDAPRPVRVSLEGGKMPESRDFTIPGDLSGAAFWLAAAAAQPGARLLVEGLGLNDTRTGFLNVLLRMGAKLREVVEDIEQIERSGSVEVEGARLHGVVVEGREIPNVIDELPIIAVLGALASDQTTIRDAAELRVKETDRIAALCANLRAMGALVEERPDGLTVMGGHPLQGTHLPSFGDHRIAMAFAIAGLFAEGETVIEGAECIEISYPGFAETLQKILAASTSGPAPTVVVSDARAMLPE